MGKHSSLQFSMSAVTTHRAWRNYYHGNSTEMDRQLAELDDWRLSQCRTHLAACEQDPDGAVAWFERLVEDAGEVAPQGVYSHHEEAGARTADAGEQPDPWRHGMTEGHEQFREGRAFSTTQQLQMADLNQTPLMDIRVVALYPTHIPQLASRHGVRFRSRQKAKCTLVPCAIESLDGRSIATPEYAIPAGTPAPKYRLQFETTRLPPDDRRRVRVVLSAEPNDAKTDPKQALLSPIFDDGNRMIFEFRRADILTVARRGERIPEGEANLSFDTGTHQIAKSPNHEITKE